MTLLYSWAFVTNTDMLTSKIITWLKTCCLGNSSWWYPLEFECRDVLWSKYNLNLCSYSICALYECNHILLFMYQVNIVKLKHPINPIHLFPKSRCLDNVLLELCNSSWTWCDVYFFGCLFTIYFYFTFHFWTFLIIPSVVGHVFLHVCKITA